VVVFKVNIPDGRKITPKDREALKILLDIILKN